MQYSTSKGKSSLIMEPNMTVLGPGTQVVPNYMIQHGNGFINVFTVKEQKKGMAF